MKIYDCFTYFNEDLILDLRFNILDKYVDYFVIVEANKTHSNE
jgi:beta-1,4-mannosyl-glycoprotein beta-1,4-N-acetylglucosaminyltransferase